MLLQVLVHKLLERDAANAQLLTSETAMLLTFFR